MLGFVLSTARAEDQPDGTLKLSGGSVAVGIGYSWEGGTLTYKGKTYQVEVKGLSVGDVGITKAEASGDVYHMPRRIFAGSGSMPMRFPFTVPPPSRSTTAETYGTAMPGKERWTIEYT